MTLFASVTIGRGLSESVIRLRSVFEAKKIVLIILLLFFIIFMSVNPLLNRFTKTYTEGRHSFIATYEFKLGSWLKEHTLPYEVILSDYRTMYLLNGLSNKISIVNEDFLSTRLPKKDQKFIAYIKQEIFINKNPEKIGELYSMIELPWFEQRYLKSIQRYGVQEINFLVIITPRTCEWLSMRGISDVIYPKWNNCRNYEKIIKDFIQSSSLTLIYNDTINDVYVFKYIKGRILDENEPFKTSSS